MNMNGLHSNVVLITGGSSGIGKATALKLVRGGARVTIASRNEDRLLQAKRDIFRITSQQVETIVCDIRSEDQIKALFQKTVSRYGKIDAYIHSVGIPNKGELADLDTSTWDDVMSTNLRGMFICLKETVNVMKQQNGGTIVVLGSLSGFLGFKLSSLYCATKHGVAGMMKVLRHEVKKYDIQATMICPGKVNTPFFDAYSRRPPSQIMLEPDDIAELITALVENRQIKAFAVRLANVFRRLNCLVHRFMLPQFRGLKLSERLNMPFIL